MVVEFSEDFNKVAVRGSRFHAEPSKTPGKCGDCAFKETFTCNLTAAVLVDRPGAYMEMGLSQCQAKLRADGRDVTWVLDI